jgi:hypothetical protein
MEMYSLSRSDPAAYKEVMREYSRADFYFFCKFVLSIADWKFEDGRRMIDTDFWFQRCRDLEAGIDGVLNYWARGHGKSTLITFALAVWRMMKTPSLRISIFSITKEPAATDFVGLIKREFESNELLRLLFDDVLWQDGESPRRWTKTSIDVKGNTSKDASFSAYGFKLEDVPTGTHPDIVIFDDIVDFSNCRSDEHVSKALDTFRAIINCTDGDYETWFAGTAYDPKDLYYYLQKEGFVTRVFKAPCVDVSRPRPDLGDIGGGEPVFMSVEGIRKRKGGGDDSFFRRQMLCDEVSARVVVLDNSLVQYYDGAAHDIGSTCTKYILCDPAGRASRTEVGNLNDAKSDDSAILVVGLGRDGNFYWLDGIIDVLSPTERLNAYFRLHQEWTGIGPRVVEARIEEAGASADTHFLEAEQRQRGYNFKVCRVPRGGPGSSSKQDRIYARMSPQLELGKVFFPRKMMRTRRGKRADLVSFVVHEEIGRFPLSRRDNFLDAWCLLEEPVREGKGVNRIDPLVWPSKESSGYGKLGDSPRGSSVSSSNLWMV